MKPLKIAVCTNHFAPLIGGCEAVTGKIANYLAGRGHQVYIFTRRWPKRKASDYPSLNFAEYVPGDIRSFNAKMIAAKPDVVLVYSDVFDFFRHLVTGRGSYRLILALCGANWVHQNRGYAQVLYRNIGHIQNLVCHSIHDRDYKLCTSHRLQEKTVVIPNGVDLSEFDNNHLTRQDLLPEFADKKWVVNVSNFFPGKGQVHLIDILSRLPQDEFVYLQISSDIEFPIGKQLEQHWVLNTKKKLKCKHRLLKNLPREKVIGFLNRSNVFAFSSEKEVAPLVVLEAMAAKLPWVAADVGNTRGLKGGKYIAAVKNSRHHSVFDDRVCSLFAKAIEAVWKSPATAEAGRQQIETEMTWDIVLPQYAHLIETNDA